MYLYLRNQIVEIGIQLFPVVAGAAAWAGARGAARLWRHPTTMTPPACAAAAPIAAEPPASIDYSFNVPPNIQ